MLKKCGNYPFFSSFSPKVLGILDKAMGIKFIESIIFIHMNLITKSLLQFKRISGTLSVGSIFVIINSIQKKPTQLSCNVQLQYNFCFLWFDLRFDYDLRVKTRIFQKEENFFYVEKDKTNKEYNFFIFKFLLSIITYKVSI